MSVASIMKNDAGIEELSYREINCDVINAVTVNATTVNGGGGDGSQNLTSVLTAGNDGGGKNMQNVGTVGATGRIEIDSTTDCQIVFCPTTQSTAGLHYGLVASTSNLYLGLWNGPQSNLAQFNVDGSAQICSNGVLNVSNGTTLGRVYDEVINKPTLQDVLSGGNSAYGLNIADVGTMACTNLTVTNINGSSYPPSSSGTLTKVVILNARPLLQISTDGTAGPFTLLQINPSQITGSTLFKLTPFSLSFAWAVGGSYNANMNVWLGTAPGQAYSAQTSSAMTLPIGTSNTYVFGQNQASLTYVASVSSPTSLYLICSFTSAPPNATQIDNGLISGILECSNPTLTPW